MIMSSDVVIVVSLIVFVRFEVIRIVSVGEVSVVDDSGGGGDVVVGVAASLRASITDTGGELANLELLLKVSPT